MPASLPHVSPAKAWRRSGLADKVAVALLILVTLAYFSPYLVTGRTPVAYDLLSRVSPWRAGGTPEPKNLMTGDVITQQIPWLVLYRRAVAARELPLWNPYNFSGMPFQAYPETAVFYPLHLLGLIGSLETGFLVYIVFHTFLTGLGAYLLWRRLGLFVPAALLGALAWMLCGYQTVWRLWTSISCTLAWLPWLLLLTYLVVTGRGRRAVAGLALIVALILTAGHPQHAYYGLLAAASLALWECLLLPGAAWRLRLERCLQFAAACLLGMGLSLVQILPAVTLSGLATRQPEPIQTLMADALPWRQLLTLLVPDLYGNVNAYRGAGNYPEFTGYVGILTLMLALLALLHPRLRQRRELWFFACLALVALHLAYGGRLNVLLSYLPGYTSFRALERLYAVWSLCMAGLAAWGLEAVVCATGWRRWPALILAAGLATTGLLLLAQPALPALLLQRWSFGLPLPPDWAVRIGRPTQYFAWACLAAGFGLALALAGRSQRPALAFVLALTPALLMSADLIYFGWSYLPATDPGRAYPLTPGLAYLQTHAAQGRIARMFDNLLQAPVPPNSAAIYGLEDIDGYSSMNLERYNRLIALIEPARYQHVRQQNDLGNFENLSALRSPLLDMLGVTHLLAAAPVADADAYQDTWDQPTGELLAGQEIGQTFRVSYDGLYRIDVGMATYARPNQGRVRFELRRAPDDPEVLAASEIDVATLADNTYVPFVFPPLGPEAGRSFYLGIVGLDGVPGNAVTVWSSSSDAYPAGRMWRNRQPAPGDLRFRAYAQSILPDKWRLAYAGPEMVLYRNPQALPLAWIVGHAEVRATDAGQQAALAAPAFDPARQAVLAAEPAWPLDEQAAGQVRVLSRTLNSLQLEADVATAPGLNGLLVLRQNMYPGWLAEVDGKPAPLLTTNYTLTGLVLSGGHHIIRLRFAPQDLAIGSGLALCALAVLLSLVFLRGRPAKVAHG